MVINWEYFSPEPRGTDSDSHLNTEVEQPPEGTPMELGTGESVASPSFSVPVPKNDTTTDAREIVSW